MKIIGTYFTAAVPKGIGGLYHSEHGIITFRKLSLKRAQQLWEDGLPQLHLLPEGARALYGKRKAEERIALVKLCKTVAEVDALFSIRGTNAALKKAITNRLKELAVDVAASEQTRTLAAE
jgi:hypothetical protein